MYILVFVECYVYYILVLGFTDECNTRQNRGLASELHVHSINSEIYDIPHYLLKELLKVGHINCPCVEVIWCKIYFSSPYGFNACSD